MGFLIGNERIILKKHTSRFMMWKLYALAAVFIALSVAIMLGYLPLAAVARIFWIALAPAVASAILSE